MIVGKNYWALCFEENGKIEIYDDYIFSDKHTACDYLHDFRKLGVNKYKVCRINIVAKDE